MTVLYLNCARAHGAVRRPVSLQGAGDEEGVIVNPVRSIVLAAAAGIAFWRGWMLHGERAWMAFGLGVLALGLAVWHWMRRSS